MNIKGTISYGKSFVMLIEHMLKKIQKTPQHPSTHIST